MNDHRRHVQKSNVCFKCCFDAGGLGAGVRGDPVAGKHGQCGVLFTKFC